MNKLSKNIIGYAIIILIIVALFLLKGWWKPMIIESLGGFTEKTQTVTIDTTIIKVDSIFPVYPNKEIEVVLVPDMVMKSKLDSILKSLKNQNNGNVEGIKVDSLRYYNYAIEDSILKGNIETITNTMDGKIVKQDFNYTSKVPMYINKTITIEKEITNTLANKPRVMVGAGVDVTSDLDLGVNIYYKTKGNLLLNLGAVKTTDVNRNNYVKVGIGFLF